ncbi:sigma-54-dependent Fis family transcriptional regulator [bacterium]|nr:sigma-54-dependent Fis family transcriptional regulator [bacterium]
MNKKILVIDDDQDLLEILTNFLGQKGFDVDTAYNGRLGIKKLERDHDIVLCDLKLPDFSGLDILTRIKNLQPNIPVILITGYSDVKTAVSALRKGAADYVTKPLYPDEIVLRINEVLEQNEVEEAKEKNTNSTTARKAKPASLQYVEGECAAMKSFNKNLQLVAPTNFSVIILGETGSGKEFVAKRIHSLSERKDKPFVAIDCGALSNELAGSELFGHKKGAFTGAVRDKAGQFELASGGTLFLDEVGNLSYENQVKLLRALEEQKVRRIGSDKEVSVDIRLIVATNENLSDAIEEGEFREDLYYRMNEFTLNLPPLRKRGSDVMIFANHFREIANHQLNKEVNGFDSIVKKGFENYAWPGNIRELKNTVKRAVLLCQGDVISEEEVPNEIFMSSPVENEEDELEDADLRTVVERAEKKAIIRALQKHHFNKTLVAKALNVDRKTLYNKINAYGIEL